MLLLVLLGWSEMARPVLVLHLSRGYEGSRAALIGRIAYFEQAAGSPVSGTEVSTIAAAGVARRGKGRTYWFWSTMTRLKRDTP